MPLIIAEILWRFWLWLGLPATLVFICARLAGATDIPWAWGTALAWAPALGFIVVLAVATLSRPTRRWLALRFSRRSGGGW